MKGIGVALFLLATAAVPVGAQTITGTVMDTAANARVAAARVILLQVDTSMSMLTDATGRFRFRPRPGAFRIMISALGYSDVQSGLFQATEKENLTVLAFLSIAPVDIMPLYVLGRSRRPLTALHDFNERMRDGMRTGFGYFIDEKKISNMPSNWVTDILRRVPGVSVFPDHVSVRPHCEDAIYFVNGIQVTEAGIMTATEAVNSMIPPSDIAAIEIYKSTGGVPPQFMPFSGGWDCGVIAIWTKQ